MNPQIKSEFDLAQSHVSNNTTLSDAYKAQLFKLLNTTAEATNGLTVEQKIQRLTESVFSLVVAHTIFICHNDENIESIAKQQITRHENRCQNYSNIYSKDKADKTPWDLKNFLKDLLLKPYPWVFLSVASFSPFFPQILDTLSKIIK